MADLTLPRTSAFAALFDAHLTPWQADLLDGVMSLSSCRRDPAYIAAAARVQDYGRGAQPVWAFYDEVHRYYCTAARLASMRSSYRSGMKARRRRG